MIKLIACDLDGTLLDSDARLRQASSTLLRRLWKDGIIVALATGRSWRTALKFQQQLGITGPIIAHNGGYVFDPRESYDTYRRDVPIATARRMLDWATAHQTMLRCYLGYRHPVIFNFFDDCHRTQFLRAEDVVLSRDAQNLTVNPLEIFLFGTHQIAPFIEEFGMRGRDYELVVFSHDNHQEINICAPDVDKVDALQFLCHTLRISRDSVMALGDGLNDVQMLAWAGTAVAIGDGAPECRINPRYVTALGSPDPVAEALLWAMDEGLFSTLSLEQRVD